MHVPVPRVLRRLEWLKFGVLRFPDEEEGGSGGPISDLPTSSMDRRAVRAHCLRVRISFYQESCFWQNKNKECGYPIQSFPAPGT